jgi:membrane protease YdiL (CAAX protease family)
MGLALAALVWRTGSLWAAIGVHVGFNAIGLTVVGAEGVLSGAQLFLFGGDDLLPLMRIDLATTAALLAFVLSPWAPFGPPPAPARA